MSVSKKDLIDLANALNVPRMIGSVAAFLLIGALWFSGAVDFDSRPLLFGVLPAEMILSMLWAYLSMKGIAIAFHFAVGNFSLFCLSEAVFSSLSSIKRA